MEPRDPRSSGWMVQAVVFEQPDLCRYHVRRFDGVPAIMDVAAPGTQASASLLALTQTLPPGAVLDQGIDLIGRTFVIAHPMAFAPPPPPPGVVPASSGGTKWLLLGIGGAVTVAVVAIVAMRSGEPPKPKLHFQAYGSWNTGCHPTYTLNVTTREDAKISVLDHDTTADYSGDATIELTAEEIGELDELEVTVDHRKGAGKTTVQIEPAPAAPPLGEAQYFGESYNTPVGTYTLTGGDLQSLSMGYGYGSDPAAGQIRIEIQTCSIAPLSSADDGVTIAATAELTTVTIDPAERMLHVPGVDPPKTIDVAVPLTTADGKAVNLTLTVEPPPIYGDNPAAQRFANVATAPLANAPAVGNVATPRPILMIWNGAIDRDLLGDAAPVDAPYIAIAKTASKDAGSCGPYSEYYGGYARYADRLRTDVDVKLYEARTGALVGKQYFKGKKPSCPDSVMTYGGSLSSVDGDVPLKAVMAWLKKQQG